MAIAAATYTKSSDFGQQAIAIARMGRDFRNAILAFQASIEASKDNDAITTFLSDRFGCPSGSPAGPDEAFKITERVVDLNNRLLSTDPNTIGDAIVAFCRVLGV